MSTKMAKFLRALVIADAVMDHVESIPAFSKKLGLNTDNGQLARLARKSLISFFLDDEAPERSMIPQSLLHEVEKPDFEIQFP